MTFRKIYRFGEDVFLYTAFMIGLTIFPADAATVDLTPIYQAWLTPLVNELLQGFALFIFGWVMWAFHKYAAPLVGAQLEAKASADLNRALQNGVTIAMNQLQAWEAAHKDIQVQGQITAMAAQYALNHAPDAAARFGLSANDLATKALAYLKPAMTPADTTGAVVAPAPAVQVNNLPPVGNG